MGCIASYIHQLENSGLLSDIDVPIVDTSHYTIPNMQYQKITLVNITADLPEKPLSIRKLSSSLWCKFSKLFSVVFESLNFIICNKYDSCFPWRLTQLFLRRCRPHTRVWRTPACQVFSRIKMMLHDETSWSSLQLNHCPSAFAQGHCSRNPADVPSVLPIPSHSMLTPRSRFDKINNFCCFIKNF